MADPPATSPVDEHVAFGRVNVMNDSARLRRVLRPWRSWRSALCAADRLLLCEAFTLLALARLGLRIMPYLTLRRLLMHLTVDPPIRAQGTSWPDAGLSAGRVPWAVTVAARRLPGTTCLAQALAVNTMLRRRACRTYVYLGVKERGPDGSFDAHAWVVCDGVVVLGALPDLSNYRVFYAPAGFDRVGPVQESGQ